MSLIKSKFLNGFLGIALASFFLPVGILAAEEEDSVTIEEITVTAQKREEDAQSVPIAITALSQELQESTIRNLVDINGYAPNVRIGKNSSRSRGSAITVRGISYSENDKSFDSPIAVTLDGIFIGTNSGQIIENFDVDRIEILRGPQGTLFGKNTVGGVINVVRSKPTGEFGGLYKIAGGEWGRQEFKGILNTSLGDNLAAKFFFNSTESDGYMTNTFLNEDGPRVDYVNYGVSLQLSPSDVTDVLLTIETYDDGSDVGAALNKNDNNHLVCLPFGAIFFTAHNTCAATDPGDGETEYSTERRNEGQYDTDAISLTISHDINETTRFVSVTGYRDESEDTEWDLDGTSAEFTTIIADNQYEQFSQEFRFEGGNDSMNYVVGAFLWENEYTQYWDTYHLWQYLVPGLVDGSIPLFLCQNAGALGALRCDTGAPGPGLGPGFVQKLYQHQDVSSQAIFAQIDWNISEKTVLTTGVRYTKEEKEFLAGQSYLAPLNRVHIQNFDDIQGGGYAKGLFNMTMDWNEVSPKIGITHHPREDLMYYASYSEGFHSGGFFGRNQNAVDFANTYEPEYANSFELGMKSQWMDNRLQFNATYFFNDFEDKQDSSIKQDPTTLTVVTVVDNVAGVEYSGVELELKGIVNSNFSWFATLGTLDSEYQGFISDLDGADPVTGLLEPTNNDYLTVKFAPELTYAVGANYSTDMGSSQMTVNVKYDWVDDFETNTQNFIAGHADSTGYWNASVDFDFETYRLSVFARNITDEIIVGTVDIAPLMQNGQATPGRNWGIELSGRF